MSLFSQLRGLGELGVKPTYLPWEKYLTRNLNYITVASFIAIFMGIVVYSSLGEYHFIREHVIALIFLPLIILANVLFNYLLALYSFYIIVLGLMFFFSLKMGEESEMYLFLIPLTISLLMLQRRKEIYKDVIALFGIFLGFLSLGIIGYKLNWYDNDIPRHVITIVRVVNISFSSMLTLAVTGIIVQQNSRQEAELSALLKEKETLLSEINHRVKNNMNVIISLLNLKKEQCTTDEAREALEDSKNRIYSMALIHQKVYGARYAKTVNFQEYITELAQELVHSYAQGDSTELKIHAEDCLLGLDVAMPCSQVINEVLTNSLKRAHRKGCKLELNIVMKKTLNNIDIRISDNGPGITDEQRAKTDSLGLSLIDMLCTQLEANYNFKTDKGLVFTMNFNLPK